MNYIEIIGIIAGIFVLISFLFKRMLVVRVINIIGACFFVVYGVILGAWSVAALNGVLIIIHIFYLSFKRKPKLKLDTFKSKKFKTDKAFRSNYLFEKRLGLDWLSDKF